MTDKTTRARRAIRQVASGGYAIADAELVDELRAQARQLADLVLAGDTGSEEARAAAQAVLDLLGDME